MRKKKAGWIILFIVVFLAFIYQVVLFSITQRIKGELAKNGVKVRHISLGLVRGKMKMRGGEGEKEKIKWEFSSLEVSFSPLRLMKNREIENVIVKGWEVSWHSNPSLPDPNLPWIKQVILEEGRFILHLPNGEIRGSAKGIINNIGEGRKAKVKIKGNIEQKSCFWIEGKFQLPDPNEYLEGKGEVDNLALLPLVSFFFQNPSTVRKGKGMNPLLDSFLQKTIPLSANLSFEGRLIKREIEFVALLEGKWMEEQGKLRIKGKGRIPKIHFTYQLEK